MSEQRALFDEDAPAPAPTLTPAQAVVVRSHVRHIQRTQEAKKKRQAPRPKQTLQERFERYHQANPGVYSALVAMARELQAKGVRRYGIAPLWEVLRYRAIVAKDTDGLPFKLSNNHRAYYARAIMAREQDLADFFTTRATRS